MARWNESLRECSGSIIAFEEQQETERSHEIEQQLEEALSVECRFAVRLEFRCLREVSLSGVSLCGIT
jgi:hypothetical protein